jgi:hypothetical protein
MGEGMKFCTGCGATVGQPAAPAPQAPPTAAPVVVARPVPVAAAATAGAAPAAKSGSPVVKIILIVVAVIFFLGLLSIGSCVYMLYRAKKGINQFEKQVQTTFPRPMGTREVQTQPVAPTPAPATPSVGLAPDLASLAYPGATAPPGGNESITGMGGVNLQQLVTSDSVDTVLAFYKGKLGASAMVTQSGGQAVVQVVGSNGVVNVAIAPDQASGKTKITLSSFGK